MKNKIVAKLMLYVGIIIIITVSGVGYYFSDMLTREIEKRADAQMFSVENGIADVLKAVNDLSSSRVHIAMNILIEKTLSFGQPAIGRSVLLNGKEVPTLSFGRTVFNSNYELVDDITKRAGATATLFVSLGDDFVRISTNVKKDDGSRAVGTILDPKGKAINAIRKGEPFYGVVDILGKQYMTGYEPIKDRSQNVIGVWYVGYPISELKAIGETIGETVILEHGFAALLDGKKKILFHSSHVPQEIVRTVIDSSAVNSENNWDVQSNSFPEWGYTIVTAHPQSDLDEKLTATRTATLVCVLLCVVILLSVIYSFINRLIIIPVQKITEQMNNADINTVINSERTDEVGDLTNAFDSFVVSIKETLMKVSEASSAVANASAEINHGTEEMAAGAKEQGLQAAEVSSAVEELTKTINGSSKSAGDTAAIAKKAKNAAEEGGKIVHDTISEMNAIAAVVNRSAETVKILGKSSDDIGEIISVIQDIADQTNLLALNAAIEAARAGDLGRGFAVVADEVKKLAERTTKATKEIASMIKQIQAETKDAVVSMNEGAQMVSDGIVLADRAGYSLREIVSLSQEVTEMVAQIAVASEEQSTVSFQISKNIEAINSVTQENALASGQIAETSSGLKQLTENLQRLIDHFNLTSEMSNNIAEIKTPRVRKSHSHYTVSVDQTSPIVV